MSVLYIVLPLAMGVVAVAVLAFVWAARRGQFDDLDTPAIRALHDEAAGAAPLSSPRSTDTSSEDPHAPLPRDPD